MTAETVATARVVVTEAGPIEIDSMAALHAQCFDEAWDRSVFARLLDSAGVFGLLAWSAGRPAGFVICRTAADECELLSIGVAPSHCRQGIGRKLLDAALAQAARADAVSLYLEVAEDNRAARALYAALEFAPVSRRPGYYRRTDAEPVAAIMLGRNIALGACPGNAHGLHRPRMPES